MSSPADDHDGGDTSPSTLQLRLDVDDVDGDGETAINPADLRAVLTDELWRLLTSLHRETPGGIQDLADRLDRDYATVHSDCELLADVGIIQWENGAYGARVPVVSEAVTLCGTLVGSDERRHEQADSRPEDGASRHRGSNGGPTGYAARTILTPSTARLSTGATSSGCRPTSRRPPHCRGNGA